MAPRTLELTWEMVHRYVSQLSDDIWHSPAWRSGWRPEVIVGLARGGDIPAALLRAELRLSCPLKSIDPTPLHLTAADPSGAYAQVFSTLCYLPKRVLFVDDLVDSGRTLEVLRVARAQATLPDDPEPHDLYAVLLDKSFKTTAMVAAHLARQHADSWIVFPWEHNEEPVRGYKVRA